MSIKSAVRDHFVKKELQSVEKKRPAIRRALDYLSDPNAFGRKRSIALGAALVSGACRGIDVTLHTACEAATIAADSLWCKVKPEAWAGIIDTINGAVQVIEPGADLATVVFAIAGFVHARQKVKALQARDLDMRGDGDGY